MSDEGGRSASNLQQDYASYRVFDEHYEEIGKVDDIFIDENDRPEYVGVKMGFLGMKSTLIPMDIVRANDRRELLEVAASKETIKNAPSFDDDETVSPEHEAEIRQYYGLTSGSGSRRASSGSTGSSDVDLEYGQRGETEPPLETPPPRTEESRTSPPPRERESVRSETTEDDELRVQRREEELRAGTREREREDGGVKVRKRARTDRERVSVPKKREEVTVERVSMDDDDDKSGVETVEQGVDSEDGEEVRMPVKEEEVVTEKRDVSKEEIRVSKDVVEDEEVVEDDVRKEEIEVEGERDDR